MTQLLSAIDSSDSHRRGVDEELLPLAYEELRRLAARKLAGEKPGQTLQATENPIDGVTCNIDVSRMSEATATIRELRTDFRAVKRKLEQHGEIVITDRGEPTFALKALPRKRTERPPLPDYYARLLEQRPEPMSPEETRKFWEEERGGR